MTELRDQLAQALAQTHRIEEEIDRGGMSHVFVATELALGRRVVIKLLSPHLGAEVNADRFRQEVQVSAALQHPNIVPLLSAGNLDELPYYIMPYVEGRSLYDAMAAERLPIRQAIPILRDIARALATAHRRGIIHRDIKPDNVLLTEGAAMVTDFGIAKAVSSSRATTASGSGMTSIGMSLGTPAYMAPEQAAADPDTDYRADIYAFGVLAYELLAGHHPFVADSPQSFIVAHLTHVPPPLVEAAPDIAPGLSTLVMQCLEKDPNDRPASVEEILAGLEDPAVLSTGGRPAAPGGTSQQPAHSGIRRAGWLAAGAIVALGLAFVARGGPATPGLNASSDPSIAVLPFTVIGGDTSDAYFAAGMADELTAALAMVPGLRVASRTAAFTVQAKQLPVADIGQALNVATLLEGTIRRQGTQLRVSVQLIEADDGLTRWSQRYQREITDVFAVQDDIAQAIVGALQEELGEAPAAAPLRERGTSDLTAYDFYLRGRYFFHKRGAESLSQALVYFERAVAQDPDYALAYSGMADVYGLLPLYGGATNTDSVIMLGLAAASRAIEIDSTLAEAYASRGNLRNGLWRWSEAAADFRSAIALRPGYATAHQWYGENRLVNGKVREAVAALGRARELDPLSPIMAASYGVALGVAGQDSAAWQTTQGAVELDTSLAVTRMMLGTVHLYAGRFEEAIAEFDRAESLLPSNLLIQGLLGYAYARAGRATEASAIMAAIDPAEVSGAPAIARIQLGLGEPVAALASLSQAARQRDPFFGSESLASPIFDPLRGLPEFAKLIDDVGLDVAVLADG